MRRTFAEVTLAWSGLFAFRALVYLVLISAGKAGWLAVASVAMGWPAFLLLLVLSYRYVPRRLEQLALFWFDGETFWLLPAEASQSPTRLPVAREPPG